MSKYIYKAEWRYGPNLARFTVEKETDKTYYVSECKNIVGFVYGRMIRKSDAGVFQTESEAWLYLYNQSEGAITREKERLSELIETSHMLAGKVTESSK